LQFVTLAAYAVKDIAVFEAGADGAVFRDTRRSHVSSWPL